LRPPLAWVETVRIRTRAVASVAVFAALVAASSASSAPGLVSPLHTASVSLSSSRAGARDVTLTLILNYQMQCGYPGPGSITVGLPAAEHVPARLALAHVIVNSSAPASVGVSGHMVRVGLKPPPPVMCDEIGPGSVTIIFTRAAGLTNPAGPGHYTVVATRAGVGFSAKFTITAA
jgi:hypothetical protein